MECSLTTPTDGTSATARGCGTDGKLLLEFRRGHGLQSNGSRGLAREATGCNLSRDAAAYASRERLARSRPPQRVYGTRWWRSVFASFPSSSSSSRAAPKRLGWSYSLLWSVLWRQDARGRVLQRVYAPPFFFRFLDHLALQPVGSHWLVVSKAVPSQGL